MAEAAPVVEQEVRNPKDLIPGLEITWEMADNMGWEEDIINVMQMAKKQFANVHIIPIADEWFVVRSLARREYRTLLQTQTDLMNREIEGAGDSSSEAIRATIQMMSEEAIAIRGTVYPGLDENTIRNKPSGVATTLHNTILEISGYLSNPMPLKI